MVYVPNAFTPDEDGLNEGFKPEILNQELITKYQFEIYNRWGEQVYTSKQIGEEWYGQVRQGNHFVPNDVYVWKLNVTYENTEVVNLIGHVTIVR